ncbi:MAG: PPC domain-containing protein [Leptolyngbyaceae cyanobacterium MO_188.B28]|nr:PPC domain-containing protein [Leptolyngbyaceae cyanobacterium MO_188.B28]
MVKSRLSLSISAVLLSLGFSVFSAKAQDQIYSPIPFPESNEITDTLSAMDIPTGAGGYARDYVTPLKAGDQIVIDLISEDFDAVIRLIAPDGSTFAENDDGPDGTTNAKLSASINDSGDYILRVSPYERGIGSFNLKVTHLD